jgi:hypothetical protein
MLLCAAAGCSCLALLCCMRVSCVLCVVPRLFVPTMADCPLPCMPLGRLQASSAGGSCVVVSLSCSWLCTAVGVIWVAHTSCACVAAATANATGPCIVRTALYISVVCFECGGVPFSVLSYLQSLLQAPQPCAAVYGPCAECARAHLWGKGAGLNCCSYFLSRYSYWSGCLPVLVVVACFTCTACFQLSRLAVLCIAAAGHGTVPCVCAQWFALCR